MNGLINYTSYVKGAGRHDGREAHEHEKSHAQHGSFYTLLKVAKIDNIVV